MLVKTNIFERFSKGWKKKIKPNLENILVFLLGFENKDAIF